MTAPVVSAELAAALEALALVDPADPSDAAQRLRAIVTALNGAKPLDAQTVRTTATQLYLERGVPDARRLVDAAFAEREKPGTPGATDVQGQVVAFADPEPWLDPVDGAELLEALQGFAGRFLALPRGADALFPAFVVATYASEIFPVAPYLVVHSPAPQCGKTRALEVLELLVRRPWRTIVPSTAVLFRVLEQSAPTLLLDEAEVVQGRGDAAADVRALLQSGYRRGALVPRCVGDSNEVRNFRVFGPKVFALIGQLPAALFDRCIPVEMQRRPRGERGERFRPTRLEPEALALRRMARRWVRDQAGALAAADPVPLDALDERQQEVWDPLFAIGLVAGGGWYERLQTAAVAVSSGREAGSLGLTLLADLHLVFGERLWLASADAVQALNALEGRPWADWNRGKGLTPNALARQLKPFGAAPTVTWQGEQQVRGYKREAFEAPWAAYLHPEPSHRHNPSNDATNWPSGNRHTNPPVTVADSPDNPHGDWISDGVTVESAGGPGLEADIPLFDPDQAARGVG